MKHKLLLRRFFASLLLLAASTMLWAYDFYINGIYYNKNLDGASVSVTYKSIETTSLSNGSYQGTVNIPATIIYDNQSYRVTSIGERAFRKSSKLTSITIPNSVTEFGYDAFSGCSGLTSVIIPESVTSIGGGAFYGCSGLTSLTIPTSVTNIGSSAFDECSGLTSVTIPNTVTSIGYSVFRGCRKLTSITIPSSVTTIGESAFSGCFVLSSINIPKSVTSIGQDAFYNCSGLTSISIPNSVTTVGESAFKYCSKLTSITIPNSVTTIGESAFESCSKLTSITIPNSVKSIGWNAFKNCSDLTSVTINSNAILSNSYYSSGNISDLFGEQVKEYIIGENILNIGSHVFSGCYNLTSILVDSNNLVYDSRNDCNAIIETSSNTLVAGCTKTVIPKSVTSIGSDAFLGRSDLTFITIPNSVTSIGSFAFSGCSGLRYITIPKSVTSIENGTFYGCSGLTSVTIPNTVTRIGDGAFYGSSSLKSVTIPNSVTTIGSRAFYDCSSLSSMTLGDNVTTIGSNALKKDISVYVKATGVRTIMSLWKYGICPYLSGTSTKIPSIQAANITASSLLCVGIPVINEEYVVNETISINGKSIDGRNGKIRGLTPDNNYTATYSLTAKDDMGQTYTYSQEETFSTETLLLTTSQPKVISVGNVIVEAESNLDDTEENVGFEWRRTDWTDDFSSNTGAAYLYEGTMEGYIRNLNTEKLWKYRPYYKSDSGSYFYGDWVGIDPTNTSYFEPTVHTYANISVVGNKVMVTGYVQRGSDAVKTQGFKYWVSESNAREATFAPVSATAVPREAKTVEAEGRVMEADLTNLDYNTTYSYVAFVTTTEGETFYGKQLTFTTGDDPMGIEEIPVAEKESSFADEKGNEDAPIYELMGRRLSEKPKSGYYIQNGKKYLAK